MSFPILRLPLLASTKVIKYIDVEYIIPLIHLSKRAKILVKRSKVPIELTVFPSSIQFQKLAGQGNDEKLECFDLSESPPKNLLFKPPCDLEFDTKIEYQIGAYKKVMDDIVEFFKVCSVSFELGDACSYTALCYLEHAKALGLKFTTAHVVIGGSNRKVYQDLLKICSKFSELYVLFETEEKFTFNGFHEYKMRKLGFVNKSMRLYDWFTVDHMCALINCLDVSVKRLNWRSDDFNRFIKFWKTSGGRLQSLVLKKQFWQMPIIPRLMMNGLNNREVGVQAYEIKGADGVKVEVACWHWRFTFKVIDA